MEHPLVQVADFMENIKSVESTPTKSEPKKKEKKAKIDKKGDCKPPHNCKTHGPNWSLDTKDCRCPSNDSNDNKNKTWLRKAEEDKKKSQQELAAVIAKAVKGQVKKQLASAKKKCRSDDNNGKGRFKCFFVESLTGKLDGFNCNQMESLTPEDEILDDVSG